MRAAKKLIYVRHEFLLEYLYAMQEGRLKAMILNHLELRFRSRRKRRGRRLAILLTRNKIDKDAAEKIILTITGAICHQSFLRASTEQISDSRLSSIFTVAFILSSLTILFLGLPITAFSSSLQSNMGPSFNVDKVSRRNTKKVIFKNQKSH